MNKIVFYFLAGIAVSFSTEATDATSNLEEIQSSITESLASQNEDAIKAIGNKLYDFFQRNIYGKELTPPQYLEYFRAYRSFLLFVIDGSAAAAKTYAEINGQNPPDPDITDNSLIRDFRLLRQEGDSNDLYDDNARFKVKYKMIYAGEDILAANEESDSQYAEILKRELPSRVTDRYKNENFWLMPKITIDSQKTSLCYPSGDYSDLFGATPPLRKNLVGRCSDSTSGSNLSVFAYMVSGKGETGWKIHVSATISSASKIAELVIPILKEKGASWKIIRSIPAFRYIFYANRYYFDTAGQVAKFITIYPKNDAEAVDIATAIDQVLKREIDEGRLKQSDFFPCPTDLKIGSTGGIFTRFDFFGSGVGDENRRSSAIIASQHESHSFENYEHPFGALGLSYGGVAMPLKIKEWAKFGLFGKGPSRPDAPFLTGRINPYCVTD
jgi:hypothetical protein